MLNYKGSEYEQTKNTPLKEVALKIKREITAKFPEIAVSVKTEHYSMGCSINIYVTAYSKQIRNYSKDEFGYPTAHFTPEAKALLDSIQAIADKYNYDNSDLQTDYFDSRFHCSPEFSSDLTIAESNRFGVRY